MRSSPGFYPDYILELFKIFIVLPEVFIFTSSTYIKKFSAFQFIITLNVVFSKRYSNTWIRLYWSQKDNWKIQINSLFSIKFQIFNITKYSKTLSIILCNGQTIFQCLTWLNWNKWIHFKLNFKLRSDALLSRCKFWISWWKT